MAEAFSRALFTGEQVLDLLQAGDSDGEELCDDSFDEVFFPGSDDELGFGEEVEDEFRFVTINNK